MLLFAAPSRRAGSVLADFLPYTPFSLCKTQVTSTIISLLTAWVTVRHHVLCLGVLLSQRLPVLDPVPCII